MTDTPIPIVKLDELLAAIKAYDDPRRAAGEWKQVYGLLQKAGLASGRFQAIVGMRNVDALEALIDGFRRGAVAEPDWGPDAETCKRALRVFRKRKFTRLDDESKLGRSPLSKGADKRLGAIAPPAEFPDAVWQALVRQGKLRYLGDGLYELPDS